MISKKLTHVKLSVCRLHRSSKSLLPLHTSRTLLCLLLLSILSLELCESILTSISLSSILTVIAVLSCWVLHRETEMRDGFGTAVSGGGFTIIGLSRTWKLLYLCRYNIGYNIKYTLANYFRTFMLLSCCVINMLFVVKQFHLHAQILNIVIKNNC